MRRTAPRKAAPMSYTQAVPKRVRVVAKSALDPALDQALEQLENAQAKLEEAKTLVNNALAVDAVNQFTVLLENTREARSKIEHAFRNIDTSSSYISTKGVNLEFSAMFEICIPISGQRFYSFTHPSPDGSSSGGFEDVPSMIIGNEPFTPEENDFIYDFSKLLLRAFLTRFHALLTKHADLVLFSLEDILKEVETIKYG